MRCEVLSAANEEITGFEHVTQCSLVGRYQRCGGTCFLRESELL